MLMVAGQVWFTRGNEIMSQTPSDNNSSPPSSNETETRRNAILTKQNPIDIIKGLPPAVFPVECRFSVRQGRTQDRKDTEYRQPSYPVDLHHSAGVYVPDTTIHFDNPARRPPNDKVVWRPDGFSGKLRELFDKADTLSEEDISLTRITVVEVPQHLVTTDAETGDPVVKPALYDDEAEMTLARFRKHDSLSATKVRNNLSGDALPGESRTPVRLTDLISVTAKPTRHGRHTTGAPGRDRFYTDTEAEKTDNLSRTPAHYQSRYIGRESERTRPLGPAVSSLDGFVPELVRNSDGLVQVVSFVGHERERQSFVATGVRR